MKLSSKQFLTRMNDNNLAIAFVGMSNIGKSFFASRFAKAYPFKLKEVDRMIWERMGHDSMEDLADWQGHPYEEGYGERETMLVEFETNASQKAIDSIKGNTVLDTTGSVIYVDPAVRRAIKEKCYVVHIKAEPSDLERLKWDYFDNPKPLIWGGHYRPKAGLDARENIYECYPKLLMSRAKDYAAMADKTVLSREIMDQDLSKEDMLALIKPSR